MSIIDVMKLSCLVGVCVCLGQGATIGIVTYVGTPGTPTIELAHLSQSFFG